MTGPAGVCLGWNCQQINSKILDDGLQVNHHACGSRGHILGYRQPCIPNYWLGQDDYMYLRPFGQSFHLWTYQKVGSNSPIWNYKMLFWVAGQSFRKKKSVDILYYRRGLGELEGEGGSKANRLNLNPLFQPPSLHRVAQGGLKTTRLVNRESDLGFLCNPF